MENSLLWIPITLFIKEILGLLPSEIGYTMRGYNIKCVQITGIITAKDITSKFIEYAVDDGSGVLSCIHWQDHLDINLGDLVTIKGKLQDFRNKRQLNVSQILVERDVNMELLRSLIAISNHDIYNNTSSDSKPQFQQGNKRILKLEGNSFDQVYTNSGYVTESDLNLFILAWIKDKFSIDGSFTYSQILEDSKIVNYGLNVLKCQFNEDSPDHSRLSRLLKKSILDLANQGLIYLSDEYNDIYSLIDYMDLDKIVHDWLQHDSCLELLISRLKEDAKYQNSTRARVNQSIGRLIEQGFVYEKEPGAYGCVQ